MISFQSQRRRRIRRSTWALIAFMGFAILLPIGGFGLLGYVIYHFLMKWW